MKGQWQILLGLKVSIEEYYEDLDTPSSFRWELLSIEHREMKP